MATGGTVDLASLCMAPALFFFLFFFLGKERSCSALCITGDCGVLGLVSLPRAQHAQTCILVARPSDQNCQARGIGSRTRMIIMPVSPILNIGRYCVRGCTSPVLAKPNCYVSRHVGLLYGDPTYLVGEHAISKPGSSSSCHTRHFRSKSLKDVLDNEGSMCMPSSRRTGSSSRLSTFGLVGAGA